MAIEWKFLIDALEIDEPVGFQDIIFTILRDDNWHGIIFEASTSSLKFYSEAFDYLYEKKQTDGVSANVIFTASSRCEGESEFVIAIQGKLNFTRYQETCGSQCMISLPVEQSDCTMILKNRFDQKISVDSNIAVDKTTVLQSYAGLGFDLELATQAIPISADASVGPDGDGGTISAGPSADCDLLVRPVYATVRDNSITTGQLDNPANFFQDCDRTFYLSPQVLIEEREDCLPVKIPYLTNYHEWEYDVRLKGTVMIHIVALGALSWAATLKLVYWDGVGNITADGTIIDSTVIEANMVNDQVYSFDETYTGSEVMPWGVGVYAYLEVRWLAGGTTQIEVTYNFEPETSFLLSAVKLCPATDAKVYLVNELLSRLAESITNRCLTVQSDYYGRTDSEPYASTVDGCGGLRVLTSGLKIRQATDKEFFASLKEVLEGLKAIDNIGMGIETDRLRIEPVEYFYNDTLSITIDLIPEAQKQIVENLIYSIIKTGYKKWEIKSVKGIDEINSTKEFRTSISTVNKVLDIQTDLIASGYIIEQLRTSTLANSGNADSTYDNDIFIICLERSPYAYGGLIVEQDVAENVTDVFSPTTVYNWRIRPLYNLMRWAKSIFPAYTNFVNTANKIFFSSGTGNYLASGNLPASDDCRLENKALAENTDLSITDFDGDDYIPIWQPETIAFDYPFSINDYQLVKDNPYGYLNIQCGNGNFIKAYIKNIEYSPAKGTANFTLLLKWQ